MPWSTSFHYNLPQAAGSSQALGSRFGGAAGLLKFCRTQAVVSDRFTAKEPYWFPTSTRTGRTIARVARFMSATIGGVGSPADTHYRRHRAAS